MKCAVIKIVISLTIHGICLTAGDIGNELAIVDGPSTKIQSCIGKVIEHILKPTESLTFVISSHPDYIPSRLPNPVTVVDVRAPLPTNYKRYEVNYVIEAESFRLLVQTMNTIFESPLWHGTASPKGKFVILFKEEKALKRIFFALWRQVWALHIIVVIYDDTSKNCPMKVITSNPQAEGNNCAGEPEVFSNFTCDNISIEFLKPIRNYNGCPVYFKTHLYLLQLDLNQKGHTTIYNVLAGLKHTLNVTPILLLGNSTERWKEVQSRQEIAISERFFGTFHYWENSIIFSSRLFMWNGPPPTRISPLKTVFLPFTYDLWIAVLFITILIILLKWMIIKGNGYNNNYVNLACAFTDIIGLTFGVCVNRIPNIWSLKLLLGFFLVYVIHIHTAYTSDLINILTVPRYEGVINNVEEVAASGLPILIWDDHAEHYFKNVTDGGNLLREVNKLIIPLSSEDYNSLKITMTKCFVVCDQDMSSISNSEIRIHSKYLRKNKVSMFLTNDITGDIKNVFILRNGSYFAESLNAVITHLWESGTHEADANLNPIQGLPVKMKQSEFAAAAALKPFLEVNNRIARPLHLIDLLPIFVILLICYSFCIIIFVAEIFVHKIVTRHSNQVVPLNV